METKKEEKKFSKDELEQIEILSDPVKWAEKYLRDPTNPKNPFELRWYQKEILSCKNRKKVIRAGRRLGKSVTLITEILWKLFVNPYRKIVLITPYQSQIAELWDTMEKMIENSRPVKSSIKRKVNNPQELELYNGSQLKCFTAGSKSSSKGENIRSLSAQDIYLDEADFLGESALSVIEPLFLTSKDTTIWASSTPSGRRETFWKWCTRSNDLGFTAFHFPASYSPAWVSIEEAKKKNLPMHESTEYFFRKNRSESVYQHEFEAEFGDEEEGVFKASFVDNNIYDFLTDYDHGSLDKFDPKWKQDKRNTYIMGIDWNNSTNGTQVVITEFLNHPKEITYYEKNEDGKDVKFKKTFKDKFRLFYRNSFKLGEDTQLYSVNKIIELLNKFKIDHIYCDLGYGQTNIELIREYGKKNKGLGLNKKLVPIDFGSSVQIIDPLTKKVEKKPMKPFIIYTAVNEIEKGNCILPNCEDDDGRLISQIRSYTIKKHSQSGMPIFSQGDDHILIAWLLSIVGFHMEYHTLIKPEVDPNLSKIGRIYNPSVFVPGLAKAERETIKDSKSIESVFKFDDPKPIIPGNKITTDPGFYNDTEKQNSYVTQKNSHPWRGQVQKVTYMNPKRKISLRSSPSGRKLI